MSGRDTLEIYRRQHLIEAALGRALSAAGLCVDTDKEGLSLVVPDTSAADTWVYHPLDQMARKIEKEIFP